MKKQLLNAVTGLVCLLPASLFSQTAPVLGPAASFVLFSSIGAVTNVGISQVTGNVGSNSAAGTGFGNINGLNQTISLDRVSSFYLFDKKTLKSDWVKHATGIWLAVRGYGFNN